MVDADITVKGRVADGQFIYKADVYTLFNLKIVKSHAKQLK